MVQKNSLHQKEILRMQQAIHLPYIVLKLIETRKLHN